MPEKLPPGPPYPGIVSLVLWLRAMPWLLETSRKRYGDLWTLRMMRGATFVFVSEPSLVEQVLTADTAVLNGEAKVITPLVGEHSVLVLDGPQHTAQRKLLLPSLHGDRIQRYREVIEGLCQREIASWPLNQPFEVLPRLEELTLSAIMTAIFGITLDSRRELLRARVRELTIYRDRAWTPVAMQVAFMKGWEAPRGFRQVRDPIDELIYEEITRTRNDPSLAERDDILASLVQAQDEDGHPMSDVEIRDELMTLLIQGHTSTATALAWALERLARTPEALERLRAELDAEGDEYLDAVIKETLRLRSPIPMAGRRVMAPYELGGYVLQPETMLAVNIFMMHRRPDVYPEPYRFRPERFLESPPGTYTWIPFGGGVRHCVGRSFATLELKVALRILAQQLRFEPANQRDEKLRRRGVVLSPTQSGTLVIRERRAPVTAGAE